jgi:hypothetical protein
VSPQRIQRRRTRGWRMPEGAVYVGRPTKFGNPFRVIKSKCCPTWDVEDDNGITYLIDHKVAHRFSIDDRRRPGALEGARMEAVRLFNDDLTEWLGGRIENEPGLREAIRDLAGRDLSCWCPLDQPCHADVLLEIANPRGVLRVWA